MLSKGIIVMTVEIEAYAYFDQGYYKPKTDRPSYYCKLASVDIDMSNVSFKNLHDLCFNQAKTWGIGIDEIHIYVDHESGWRDDYCTFEEKLIAWIPMTEDEKIDFDHKVMQEEKKKAARLNKEKELRAKKLKEQKERELKQLARLKKKYEK